MSDKEVVLRIKIEGVGGVAITTTSEMPTGNLIDLIENFQISQESIIDIEMIEKVLIVKVLKMVGGSQTKAAKILNLTRDGLRFKMQRFKMLG